MGVTEVGTEGKLRSCRSISELLCVLCFLELGLHDDHVHSVVEHIVLLEGDEVFHLPWAVLLLNSTDGDVLI